MNIILITGLFATIYGIAGILGFQIISARHRGHGWTKKYIRSQGISWLLLGIPWLAFNKKVAYTSADIGTDLHYV